MASAAEKYRERGLILLAVDRAETASEFKRPLASLCKSGDIAIDPEGAVANTFEPSQHLTSLTAIIDLDGKVCRIFEGFPAGFEADLDKSLQETISRVPKQ